jgi:hypothetical protein
LPEDYTPLKSDFYFGCDAFLSAPIHYTILKKKQNILIGINFNRAPTPIELNRTHAAQAMFHEKTYFVSDSNYVYAAKAEADTTHHRIIYLPHESLKNKCNGDRGVEYVRNCKTPMYLIDNHNKIVSISKDGRGHIELDYLYTDSISEKEINKEILMTAKMLQFN